MNESGLSRVKINFAIMMTCLILSLLLMKCNRDSTPNSSTLDDSDILSNDLFEPNNSRPQAYKLEPLPYLNLEGVLLSRNDIDWFKLSITGKDTRNIEAIFEKSNKYR